MQRKIDEGRSYGFKLINLFARLLFSPEEHSLIELTRELRCSKPTVTRLIKDIGNRVEIKEEIRGRQKYYRIARPTGLVPKVTLTASEMDVLQMCRVFTEHLLGRNLFDHATLALIKTRSLLGPDKPDPRHLGSYRSGAIDYTPHQETIQTLIQALEERRVCQVTYQKVMAKRAKTYRLLPLKLFAHHDSLYLHARKAQEPGETDRRLEFDPLLAVHRFKKVTLTEERFEFPKDYDFDSTFNRNFGLMKDQPFRVTVEFKAGSADYVAERTWSQDQTVTRLEDGRLRLEFTAGSRLETIAWVLSFGPEIRAIGPDWLVAEVREKAGEVWASYKARES